MWHAGVIELTRRSSVFSSSSSRSSAAMMPRRAASERENRSRSGECKVGMRNHMTSDPVPEPRHRRARLNHRHELCSMRNARSNSGQCTRVVVAHWPTQRPIATRVPCPCAAFGRDLVRSRLPPASTGSCQVRSSNFGMRSECVDARSIDGPPSRDSTGSQRLTGSSRWGTSDV